jgi:hypothetical protein
MQFGKKNVKKKIIMMGVKFWFSLNFGRVPTKNNSRTCQTSFALFKMKIDWRVIEGKVYLYYNLLSFGSVRSKLRVGSL